MAGRRTDGPKGFINRAKSGVKALPAAWRRLAEKARLEEKRPGRRRSRS